MVETAEFDSSNLHSGLYLSSTEELYLRFNSGDRIYKYESVPEGTWHDLLEADSAGSFFNQVMRSRYNGEEVSS